MSAQKKTIGELLGTMFRMLDSAHEGETLAAIAGMKRLVTTRGLTFSDIAVLLENWSGEEIEAKKYSDTDAEVIYAKGVERGRAEQARKQDAPPEFYDADGAPRWYEIAMFCQKHTTRLSAWEREFINSVAGQVMYRQPSSKQVRHLLAIFVKLGGPCDPEIIRRYS